MATDWKDILGGLKDSGMLPEAENSEMPIEDEIQAPSKKNLRVVIDKNGRKGKTATIIEGFGEDDEECGKVEKLLKQKLGTGGSSRGGEILIQGERREQVIALLREMGYKAK